MILAPEGCNAFDREPHNRNKPDSVIDVGYTPEGWLNEFALQCGYMEQVCSVDANLDLYKDGCYHVRCFNFDLHHRMLWESFDSLNDARRFFASSAKMMNFR